MCISSKDFLGAGADYCPYCLCTVRPTERGPLWEDPEIIHVEYRCRICGARWALRFEATENLRTLEGPTLNS